MVIRPRPDIQWSEIKSHTCYVTKAMTITNQKVCGQYLKSLNVHRVKLIQRQYVARSCLLVVSSKLLEERLEESAEL